MYQQWRRMVKSQLKISELWTIDSQAEGANWNKHSVPVAVFQQSDDATQTHF